ncbi:hypothetical protein ABPG72_016461 [Tetrahymena utriculariae]
MDDKKIYAAFVYIFERRRVIKVMYVCMNDPQVNLQYVFNQFFVFVFLIQYQQGYSAAFFRQINCICCFLQINKLQQIYFLQFFIVFSLLFYDKDENYKKIKGELKDQEIKILNKQFE